MIERLLRLCLVLAIAFVFTGRMEAAAEHCARLAQADARAIEASAAAPCHGEHADSAAPGQQDPSHQAPAAPDSEEACECVAVLKGCTHIAVALASTRIEPYEWARPDAVALASTEPGPHLRPPRG